MSSPRLPEVSLSLFDTVRTTQSKVDLTERFGQSRSRAQIFYTVFTGDIQQVLQHELNRQDLKTDIPGLVLEEGILAFDRMQIPMV